MRILLVDDAAFMRMMLKKILEGAGHIVAGEAGNGREAFEQYIELSPDLVMMDITMPEVYGLEGLRLIKNMDPNANIIMCSAMGQQAMVVEALQNGAKDFIVKPFQEDRIFKAIKSVEGDI